MNKDRNIRDSFKDHPHYQACVDFCSQWEQYSFDLGLNINRVGGPLAVWRIAPPLTITKSEVDQALEIMDEAFASK